MLANAILVYLIIIIYIIIIVNHNYSLFTSTLHLFKNYIKRCKNGLENTMLLFQP